VLDQVIETKDLTKIFRKRFGMDRITAVDHVNMRVRKGEIIGILGPNGAGKTTLIKMMCGLLRPTIINGRELERCRREILAEIGAVLEGSRNSIWSMTVEQNLRYFGSLKNVYGKALKERGDELLNLFQLANKKKVLVKNLSKGMKQRLAIALAFVNDPELVFMDEPTLGLDVQTARTVKTLVTKLTKKSDKTIIISTHDMRLVEQICDRVALINRGRLIALDKPSSLLKTGEQETYLVRLKGVPNLGCLKAISDVSCVELVGCDPEGESVIRIRIRGGDALFEVIQSIKKNQCHLLSISKDENRLEDIFVKMVED